MTININRMFPKMANLTPDQSNMATGFQPKPSLPHYQIRAHYDAETITVYQAYNSDIAFAAIEQQKMSASPHFRLTRMTWVKPSWCWMMYRAGYSYKDKNQERILALKMKHEHFIELLNNSTLATEPGQAVAEIRVKERPTTVKVQWDPERSPRLEKLGHRSIQIGIPGSIAMAWAEDWIVGIEDMTEKARALEKELRENPDITDQDLVDKGLIPHEREYVIPSRVQNIIGMV